MFQLRHLKRFCSNLKFIWLCSIQKCFKLFNDDFVKAEEKIREHEEWLKNISEEQECMKMGVKENIECFEDEFKRIKKKVNEQFVLVHDIYIQEMLKEIKTLKKRASTQQGRITRQTNEQNDEKARFDLLVEKLEEFQVFG